MDDPEVRRWVCEALWPWAHTFCYNPVVVIAASLPVRAAVGSEPLVLLQAAVQAVAAEACDGLDLDTVEAGLVTIRRQIDLLEADFVRRLGHAARLREFAPERPGSLVDWIRNACRLSGAGAAERVEVAQQLSELPMTGEALTRGDIGYEHARVIARTAVDVGAEAAREAEAELLQTAREADPGRLRAVAQDVRHRLDAGGALEAARRLHERRSLRLHQGPEGGFWLEGLLDPQGGATLTTALDALMTPSSRDRRTATQRRADAMVELARRGLQSGDLPLVRGQRPHVTLIVPVETLRKSAEPGGAKSGGAGRPCRRGTGGTSEIDNSARDVATTEPARLEWAGAVPAETARRIACDASVTEVAVDTRGNPLDVGRTTRTIGPALRRALAVRDRGCRFPGCDRPVAWTEGHHTRHWVDGGETKLDNLALLCQRCHTYVHEYGWRLSWGEDGELLAQPP